MNAALAMDFSDQAPMPSSRQRTCEADGHRLLEEWRKWQRGGGAAGYPHIEPFERLVSPSGGLPIGPMPDEVAATDRAVCALKHREKGMLWRVIEQHYLKDDPVDVKSARLGKSRAGFYRLLKRSQSRIADIVRTSIR
jgi:hypothetical protein